MPARIVTRSTLLLLSLAACTDASAPDASVSRLLDATLPDVLVLDAPLPDASPPDAPVPDGSAPLVLAPCTVDAATPYDAAPLRAAVLLTSDVPEQDAAFYVLTVLERAPGVLADLAADTVLSPLAGARANALREASAHCAGDFACVRAALVATDAETGTALDAIVASLEAHAHLGTVAAYLRDSGYFAQSVERGADDRALVRSVLAEALADLVIALDHYAAGELSATERDAVLHSVAAQADPIAWWQPLARTVFGSLATSHRDEATRYGTLAAALDAPAVARASTVDFSTYPYGAIVVPGQGPQDAVTMLDPTGRVRCDLAAIRFNAHLAPFVLTSGGHVHPDRTRYSEAVEMRAYLMSAWHLPADVILVDPYARHTTTNLRDATRVLLHAGVPADRPVLVVSDFLQSAYIQSDPFAIRCDTELGFRPWRGLQRLSTNDSCIALAPVSLTVDARDMLDP